MPTGFAEYWLWQYTGDGIGPQPHSIPGIAGTGIDLNAYQGTKDQLRSEWTPSSLSAITTPDVGPSSRADDEDEQVSVHAKQADTDEDPAPKPQLNIQAPKAAYSLDVEIVQRKLDRLGYHEVGDIDGRWGGKTKGALTAFLNDRHIDIVVNGGLTPAINNAISAALADGWTRPIAMDRATATAKDIAPKVEAVRQSLWQRLTAKVVGYLAGGSMIVTGASDKFASVNEKVSPIKEFFAATPGWVWFALIVLLSVIAYLSAEKIKSATVADYNTGKIN